MQINHDSISFCGDICKDETNFLSMHDYKIVQINFSLPLDFISETGSLQHRFDNHQKAE